MKKLSLVIAAVLAGTMIFGASAFAAGSSSTTTTTTKPVEQVTAAHSYSANVAAAGVVIDGAASSATVTLSPVSVAEVNNANAQAKALVAPTAQVLHMVNVELGAKFTKAQITFNVSGVVAGQKIMVLHQCADGSWEKITPDAVGNGTVTATFTSLSPVAIVAYEASAKTADVAPYVMIIAMISVLGAAVCAKKAFN